MTVNIQGVLADEISLVVGKAVHRIARAHTTAPLIIEHSHDRCRELRSWAGVPRRRKRRIEGQLMVRDLDSSDRCHD